MLSTLAVALAVGQSQTPAREKMAPLHWMAGTWEGTGFQMSGERKVEIRCKETVELKSGGAVIAITDVQSVKAPGQADFGPQREAFFTLTVPDKFLLTAMLPNGQSLVSEVSVAEGKMSWSYPNSPVKMSLGQDSEGNWLEQGHTGSTLMFELRLKKVKA